MFNLSILTLRAPELVGSRVSADLAQNDPYPAHKMVKMTHLFMKAAMSKKENSYDTTGDQKAWNP